MTPAEASSHALDTLCRQARARGDAVTLDLETGAVRITTRSDRAPLSELYDREEWREFATWLATGAPWVKP